MRLRVARHTQNLKAMEGFYCHGIGLSVLGRFRDHAGYNGLFIGLEEFAWHLEFTTSEKPPRHRPDKDDLLVFYCKDTAMFDKITLQLTAINAREVLPENPYWAEDGKTYLDPDNFRVVIAKPRAFNG